MAAGRRRKDEPAGERRIGIYFPTVAKLEEFKTDAQDAGLDYSQFGLMLIEARKNGPSLFRVAQLMHPNSNMGPMSGGATVTDPAIERARDAALSRVRVLEVENAAKDQEIAELTGAKESLQAQLDKERTRLHEYMTSQLDRLQMGLQGGTGYVVEGVDDVVDLIESKSEPMTEAAILNGLVRTKSFKTDTARLAFAQAVTSGRIVEHDGKFKVASREAVSGKGKPKGRR